MPPHASPVDSPAWPEDARGFGTPVIIKSLDTGAFHLVDNDGDVNVKPPDSVAKRLWARFYEEESLEKEATEGEKENSVPQDEEAAAAAPSASAANANNNKISRSFFECVCTQ
jgi:hypothetical protein